MASFIVNFNANTTGIHHVGYRTYNDPANTYTVIDHNVVVTGAQMVEIPVPGNLYCADSDIEYDVYVIAACMDQTDGNADGVPDLALTQTITLAQQTDPCILTEIECVAVAIDSVVIATAGSGCTDGVYALGFSAPPGDEVEAAVGTVTITAGVAVSVNITNNGKYKTTPTVTDTTPGCGVQPTYTATLEATCPTLTLADYDCGTNADLSEDSEYDLAIGDTVELCVDVATLAGLPDNFESTQDTNCHCEACQNATVSVPGATTGVGKVTYQTCWDGNNPNGALVLVSQEVHWDDTIDLGCVIPETITMDDGTLDASISVSYGSCA